MESNTPLANTSVKTELLEVDSSNPVQEKVVQNTDVIRQPYESVSEVCNTAETVAPARMLYDMTKNIRIIDRELRSEGYASGVDEYVLKELQYEDMIEFCKSFNREQVDAIAVALWQIKNNKAVIIGDSTGIGKGRICAAILKYARLNGKKPIFITEKPNLFSDIYRDIKAIGMDDLVPLKFRGELVEKAKRVDAGFLIQSIKQDIKDGVFDLDVDMQRLFKKGEKEYTEQVVEMYRQEYYPDDIHYEFSTNTNKNYNIEIKGKKRFIPFILNGRSKKTNIKDANGNIIYMGLQSSENADVLKSKKLPKEYDCILATYSQFSSGRLRDKIEFIEEMSVGNIIVMDESHNASGSSARGNYLTEIAENTQGIVFASATYAKRPDNMAIYAVKTSIADAELSKEELVKAIAKGGIAMQEILSAQLVSEGQMIRRERGYGGIEINYITLDESCESINSDLNLKSAHYAIVDKTVTAIREIINLVSRDINPIIEKMRYEHLVDECGTMLANAILEGSKAERDAAREECEAELYNTSPYAGIFNILNQMYFSLKAEAVSEWAIYRMKQGKKPVIALSSTMESVLDYAAEEAHGAKIDVDFAVVLKRRLEKALEYNIVYKDGSAEKKRLNEDELTPEALYNYERIKDMVDNLVTGITISPIDLIRKRISEAGFTVDEVTGRGKIVEFDKVEEKGFIKVRNIPSATDIFNAFNENELDCIIINQAGSTGASAHAITTDKVTKVETKNGVNIIPTSLEDKTEVKQRVMIMLQAEGDINKEVQKRGRIYRTGQKFNPIYDYIFSAIPSERRLTMMLRKKLQSLDANTSSNKDQSSEILDVVDFLNPYGDEVVAQYLAKNEEVNQKIGMPIDFSVVDKDGVAEYVPSTDIDDLAHMVTGRVAILNTDEQEIFYNEVVSEYKSYENKLKQEGKWNLGVDNLDLQAKTIDKNAITVGNPDKKSVFGGATFLELCEVNNIRKPFNKKHLDALLDGMLSMVNAKGNTVELQVNEYIQHINDVIDERAKAEYEHFKPSYERAKARELESIAKQKIFLKIKNDSKRKEAIEKEKERVSAFWDIKLNSVENIFERAEKYKKIVSFFAPKKMISYRVGEHDFEGLCIGVKVTDGSWLSPNHFLLRIAFPSTLRHLEISFSNLSMIDKIIHTTLNKSSDSQREFLGKQLYQNWDDVIRDFASDRVKRYIVTGNILKAYGIPEISNSSNKLISYSTIEKTVKRGILLPEDFNPDDLTIKVPLESAIMMVQQSIGGAYTLMSFGDAGEVYMIPRGERIMIRRQKTKLRRFHIDKDNELLKYLEGGWDAMGEYYENAISDKENVKKVIEHLYQREIYMNLSFRDFQVIAKNYDTEDRFKGEKSVEDIINEYNQLIEMYKEENEKDFVKVHKDQLKKFDEIQKELYELRKDKERNKVLKFFVDTVQYAEKFTDATMRDGGTIASLQEDSELNLISDETQIREILTHYEPKFNDIDELTKEPYYKNIGGLFVQYKDGDIVRVFAFEGSPTLEKPTYEVYPTNQYF